jgi:hypothetical protein
MESKKRGKRKYGKSVYQSLTMITQFGINMVVPIALCSFAGYYLDRWLGTSYLVIVLFFVGAMAGQGTQFEGLDQYLAGPSAFAFSYEDATAGAAVLNKVAKNVKELEFKAGVVEGVVYDAAGMKLIADIPSREVLLSKLLGSFKSPMSSFARVIDQIAKKDA